RPPCRRRRAPGSEPLPASVRRDRCAGWIHDLLHLQRRGRPTREERAVRPGRRLRAGVDRGWAPGGVERRGRRPGGGAMKLEGAQKRLTIFVGESDRVGHTPLATEIVHRAHAAGLAGASVFRGVEGFGASNHLHTTRVLSLSDDLPMAIVIVDADERIRGFLPVLEELITEGLVIIDDVNVVRYVGRG